MKKIFLGFISALTLLIFASGCDQLVEKQEKLKTSTEVVKAYIKGLGELADESYVTDSEINEIKQYTEGKAAMMQEKIKDWFNDGDTGRDIMRNYARAIAKGYISVTVDDPENNNLHTAKVYCGKVGSTDDYVLTIKLKRLDSNSQWYIYEIGNLL